MVNGWPAEDPGVTVPGDPPVMIPPTTSSPAPTDPVAPESTDALFPWVATAWSSAPEVATPPYSLTAPCRYVALAAEIVMVSPLPAGAEFCT